MILGLEFTDQFSITTILVIVGSVIGIFVTIRSGGPWKTVAEGYKAERDSIKRERDESRRENVDLHKRIVALEAKPDLEVISDVLATITQSLAAIVVSLQHIQETQLLIDGQVNAHETAAQQRNIELVRLIRDQRDPTLRTRASDG